MASVTECEFAYLDLMDAFMKAMTLVLAGSDSDAAQIAGIAAFDKAEKYGWNWKADDEWTRWSLEHSQPEIIAQGLANAIQKCKLR